MWLYVSAIVRNLVMKVIELVYPKSSNSFVRGVDYTEPMLKLWSS